LLSGAAVRIETASPVRIEGNVTQDARDWFVQSDQGDLHLKPEARPEVPVVARLGDVRDDVDRHPRAERTSVGADEPAPE
jgi:hypothetical protein